MEKTPGLPPDGASGAFIGFDAGGDAYVMRWRPVLACWLGVGFDPRGTVDRDPIGYAFLAREEMAHFIVAHAAIA